ncbi:hypothetical protein IFM89_033345 [Coptis chinensis]|uniref:Protein SHOOT GRAVITROPISM 6 n=1 Tax=Coptis chinensis TaxID=261450 RepID=A0A835HEG0_9MAGN|nr:hypothetical protein IFM89_033345 [Coptis chinensis]
MASSSSHLPDAIQVLVSSLADESSLVREASINSLKDIASLHPLLILDSCYSVSRGGRRRFGNIAGLFEVMAFAIRCLDKGDADPSLLGKFAKIATSEIISSKEYDTDWQRAAAGLLVSIGSHLPDLMMEEIFLHLLGPNSSLPAMVQILADFASVEASQFTPRLKDVLSRVLPILGNVKDMQRPIFANAFKCWCQAVWQYGLDLSSHPLLDSDVMSFLNSAFELLLRVWASSRDLKVRVASVEALGQMVHLITRTQLKTSLHRLVPTILELYKKDHDIAFSATCSLHSLLTASLHSEYGSPLLDFEDLTIILSTLLPVVSIHNDGKVHSDFAVGLKTYNAVQHCFLTVGLIYHEELFMFLLNKCRLKEDPITYGALCVVKHLLPRLAEAWHTKRPVLVEAVKLLLDEQSLGVCKAISELIVVMASHCYLVGPSGELFVEYLVRHCAISDDELKGFDSSKEVSRMSSSSIHGSELRAICEKGLLLLTITLPEMEHILWPYLLKMVIPRKYTGAVATVGLSISQFSVCRCISELCRQRSSSSNFLLTECKARDDIPKPEELFSRLVVLLHDPLARGQLATQILTVLCYLAPLFPKDLGLFWQDEVPKMKAYVSDTEELKEDSSYQETWDDMIINFLAESLDVIENREWVISLGDVLAEQYELYTSDDKHSALLHRCLGILLQKVDDRVYVHGKIDWMYKKANIAAPTNRVGLAKGMGLVAASHLDTVLEKLKDILDGIGQNIFQREYVTLFNMTKLKGSTISKCILRATKGVSWNLGIDLLSVIRTLTASRISSASLEWILTIDNLRKILAFFSDRVKVQDVDDIHAALALMYGYAARYAPSNVIEARIDALVGTNMLSRLLHVQHPTAKQAVITAIDLLGRAVINAAESGASFPLKRRDQMLDYVLTLMGRDDEEELNGFSVELLHTQTLALSAFTTLVSVEPRLAVETRNHVMKATLGFFALPNDPPEIVDPLIDNLVTLFCAILHTSGEDGRSRAELLLHILRQIDQFVSSSMEHQRRRGCIAVYEILVKFRTLCSSSYCPLGCQGSCIHVNKTDRTLHKNFSNLPSAYVLPSRGSLCLGERVIFYLPRCADTNAEVRKVSAQILDLFFSISLSLPRPVGSVVEDIEVLYSALSSLEDVIAILRSDASIDQSEVFSRVVSSVSVLLSREEFVVTLHGCTAAICDKVKQSAEGAILAIIEFVTKRGTELNENDMSRTTHSLLSALMMVTEKHLRQEVLGAISCFAESTSSKIVFDEVLIAAGKDITTKDISRLRGGWPIQDAFYAFSQHATLSILFLKHLVSVLNQAPIFKKDLERGDNSGLSFDVRVEGDVFQAAILALAALFRGGGKVGKKAVEQNYGTVLSALTLQFGTCHGLVASGQQEPLRTLLNAFQAFCECVGDLEMGKILARDGELNENERWISLIGDLASCISIKRPKEVPNICTCLSKALNRHERFQREAAAAALSEFVRYRNTDNATPTTWSALFQGSGQEVDTETNRVSEKETVSTAMVIHSSHVQTLISQGLLRVSLGSALQLRTPKDNEPIRLSGAQSNIRVNSAPHLQRAIESNFHLISPGVVPLYNYRKDIDEYIPLKFEQVKNHDGIDSQLEQMVEVMCRHVSDESSTVRRLCLRGLVQIPSIHILQHITQVLGVIVALLEDPDESVQLTAVSCLLIVLESSPKEEAVDPVLLNLSLRLRNLQVSYHICIILV